VVKFKDKELNPDSKSDPKNIENRQIIDANPIATITTATIQPKEHVYPEEGGQLFHS
jgi:hypothetical protein